MAREQFGDILRRRLRARGLDRAALAAYVCTTADRLGGGQYRAIRFRDGRLTVAVSTAVAAHELQFARETLARDLRVALGWPADQPLTIQITLRE